VTGKAAKKLLKKGYKGDFGVWDAEGNILDLTRDPKALQWIHDHGTLLK